MPRPKGTIKTGGRIKGTLNKSTLLMISVKDTVLKAFNEMQDDPEVNIVEWGKKNPKDFYNIASKLIPTEVTSNVKLLGAALDEEEYKE